MRITGLMATLLVVMATACARVQSPATQAPPAADAQGASLAGGIHVPEAEELKHFEKGDMPLYPAEAKLKRIAGTVHLHAIIGKDGSVSQLRVVDGPDIFRKAAINAVYSWKFHPYYRNGSPTSVDTSITVNFKLKSP